MINVGQMFYNDSTNSWSEIELVGKHPIYMEIPLK